MNHKEILENAIIVAGIHSLPFRIVELPGIYGLLVEWTFPDKSRRLDHESQIIYTHAFAKALWGEEAIAAIEHGRIIESRMQGWQYHLQQMVVADDPIKYLGEHLGD